MEITGNTFFFEWETSLMVWLQENLGPLGVRFGSFFTAFGESICMILIIGLIYWGIDKKFGKYLMINLFSVSLFGAMIKNVALRRRPYFDHEKIQCLRPVEKGDIYDISLQGFSFPSLHAANSITLYSLLGGFTKVKVLKIICWILPFFVGLSRVIIGVHYPTDVLVGWAFGLLMMFLMDLLMKKVKDSKWVFGILLVCALPGWFFCKSSDFYTGYGLLVGMFLATTFEKKYVKFGPAKDYLFVLLRVVGGGVVFVALSFLTKLPFPEELLSASTFLSLLIRALRYAVMSFVAFGVYPLCFNKGKLDL